MHGDIQLSFLSGAASLFSCEAGGISPLSCHVGSLANLPGAARTAAWGLSLQQLLRAHDAQRNTETQSYTPHHGDGDQRLKAHTDFRPRSDVWGREGIRLMLRSLSFTRLGACSIKSSSSWIWYAVRAHCGTLGNLGSRGVTRRGQKTAALFCATSTNTEAEWKNSPARAAAWVFSPPGG